MNFRVILNIIGFLLILNGIFMMLGIGFSLHYGSDDVAGDQEFQAEQHGASEVAAVGFERIHVRDRFAGHEPEGRDDEADGDNEHTHGLYGVTGDADKFRKQ